MTRQRLTKRIWIYQNYREKEFGYVITLEKLLLLKKVTLFQQIPDELLFQVVQSSIKEKFVNAGNNILQKGKKGRDMYIIVNGRVRVHDEDTFIKELREGEIFGELAALSFGRRVSSVTAETDCLLLKIDSNALYEVMDMDIGLAKGIIKALCERTESIAMQLQEIIQETKP